MTTQRWEDARRLEAWAGEVRVNLIRGAALVAFYGQHLVRTYLLHPEDENLRGTYHLLVTAVVLAWVGAIFVLYFCLSRRLVPPALKYVATLWDLAMITALLLISDQTSSGGPRNPLIALYFLVIAAAPLRLSLPLVYVATFGAMAAVTLVMGHHVFMQIGYSTYYNPEYTGRIARHHEIVFLLALATAGFLAGQMVRQARRLVDGYPVRVKDEEAA